MKTDQNRLVLSCCYYGTAIVTSLFLIISHQQDVLLEKPWLIFYWWLFNFMVALAFSLLNMPSSLYQKMGSLLKQDVLIVISIVVFASLTRFVLIDRYPYISLGDELRDAGLNALKINQGVIKDFFAFGDYQGYGNFIPLIGYFFLKLFGTTPLIYRLPSAFLSVGSIFLIYVVARIIGGRKIAVIASLFLTASLLHLHYGRTELLVIADSFLAPLIILTVYSAFFYQEGFFLSGLISGLSLHFYAGIRGVIVASLFYLVTAYLVKIIAHWNKKQKQQSIGYVKTLIFGGLLFCFGLIIALGPTSIKFKKNNLYTSTGTAKIIFADPVFQEKTVREKISFLSSLYEKALLSYTFEPTTDFHFRYYQYRKKESLLVSPVNWFFLVGFFYLVFSLVKKNVLGQLLLTVLLIFPVTNQVLINGIGMNHRLMAVVPILMIVAALGAVKTVKLIRQDIGRQCVMVCLVLFYLVSQLHLFFVKRASDVGLPPKEYVFQMILEHISKDADHDDYYLLSDGPHDFSPLHYHEKAAFFTYPKKVWFLGKDEFVQKFSQKYAANSQTNNSAFFLIEPLSELANYLQQRVVKNCDAKKKFNYPCPLEFTGDLVFYQL